MRLKFSEVNVPNTSGPEGAVLRAMIVFLDRSVPTAVNAASPELGGVAGDGAVSDRYYTAAAVLDAATATDAKRKLTDRVTGDGAIGDVAGDNSPPPAFPRVCYR